MPHPDAQNTAPAITIRPIEPGELAETCRIRVECLRGDYTFIPQSFRDEYTAERDLAETEAWLAESTVPIQTFAAFTGGTMVGYITVGPNTGEPAGYDGEVNKLFVRRAYRGQGISLMLLKTGLEYLRGLGCQTVMLFNYHASQANTFYRALGGEVVYRETQSPGDVAFEVEVFAWETDRFLAIVDERLAKYAG